MVILIADDEKMARITLTLMLKDMNLPSLQIIEATNGEDFLTKVELCKPEIAFVDIHMPILNGLEAIERAKEISPETVYTIVTGYSEFEFARKAIELKVDNYLLKPVNIDDLLRVVSESMEKYNRKCFELNRNFERMIIARFHNVDNLLLSDLNSGFELLLPVSKSMIFVFDTRDEEFLKQVKADFFMKLRLLSESYVSRELLIAVFNVSKDMISILCSCNEKSLPVTEAFFRDCEKLDRKISPVVMISCFKKHFLSKDINKHYSAMIELSLLRIIYRDTGRHDLTHYEEDENRDKYIRVCGLLNSLCQNYNQKNYTGYLNTVDRLKKDSFFITLIDNDLSRLNITRFVQIHTGFISDSCIGYADQWLSRIMEYGNTLLPAKNISRKYIDEVMAYVELNYMKDIGINTIADHLNITPNYLSRIFHKETNLKFTDYIAKTRISQAQKLLTETSYNIREISQKVGYRSTRHFTNLFVKFTGDYPSRYRKE